MIPYESDDWVTTPSLSRNRAILVIHGTELTRHREINTPSIAASVTFLANIVEYMPRAVAILRSFKSPHSPCHFSNAVCAFVTLRRGHADWDLTGCTHQRRLGSQR
ncbi:hypothetical protein [Aporhodopirellula aestuarii]|uniref:Uncharacterized protein n=1 Tax=Aporhodopirellula aestuarii TaxID=2950107 RepID=A0ABT0UD43_9BACT|nr:hypothetical protein [Aporhodopirellula aestuarii]MCM2374776.1 hypothetical protein [Aporhodopirellula aestuarii]